MASWLVQVPVQSDGSFGQCAAFWGTQTCAQVTVSPDALLELLLQPASTAPESAATTNDRRIDILDLPLIAVCGTSPAATDHGTIHPFSGNEPRNSVLDTGPQNTKRAGGSSPDASRAFKDK
jgi:hypothetical protein